MWVGEICKDNPWARNAKKTFTLLFTIKHAASLAKQSKIRKWEHSKLIGTVLFNVTSTN